MTAPPPAALNLAGKAFFGSLCAGTFGLGCWQTQRLFEKQELQRQRENELALAPVEYSNEKTSNNKQSFRRFVWHGRFRHDYEFLVGPRGPPAGALPDAPGTSAKGMSSAPQGYFVLTPLELTSNSSRKDDTGKSPSSGWNWPWRTQHDNLNNNSAAPTQYVLVNRGWVPRTMVTDDTRQQRGRRQPTSQSQNPDLFHWDRPAGTVEVVGVVSETEHPKFLVADHELNTRPPKLYWFDAPTMKAVARVPLEAPYVTAVTASPSNSLPLQPTADKLSEFKVTPAVHAGYAVTWFGLSAAGMVMTRKLITRGR